MIHVAIIGSRTYPNEALIRRLVRGLPNDWTVISGGARGPDTWAINEAKALGMAYEVYLADWKGPLGKGAGFARNTTIAQAADIVVAFMETATNGTMDTIRKATQLGKIVYVINDEAGVNECLSHFT